MGGTGPTKVLQAGYVEEKAHAKNVGDGLASEIKNKVNAYCKSGFAVQPGAHIKYIVDSKKHIPYTYTIYHRSWSFCPWGLGPWRLRVLTNLITAFDPSRHGEHN